jgi:hypothetical protein
MQVARRKRANTITSLQKEDGTRCEEPEEINAEIQSFYQQLYTSQGAPVMADLLNLVPARVSDEMQMNLDKDFTEEEVKLALFQMTLVYCNSYVCVSIFWSTLAQPPTCHLHGYGDVVMIGEK